MLTLKNIGQHTSRRSRQRVAKTAKQTDKEMHVREEKKH